MLTSGKQMILTGLKRKKLQEPQDKLAKQREEKVAIKYKNENDKV